MSMREGDEESQFGGRHLYGADAYGRGAWKVRSSRRAAGPVASAGRCPVATVGAATSSSSSVGRPDVAELLLAPNCPGWVYIEERV